MQVPPPNEHAFLIIKDIGIAFLTAFLTLLGAIAFYKYQEVKRKRTLVVAYLSAIELALNDMCVQFRKNDIPYQSGHTLKTLVDEFDSTMAPLVGEALLIFLRQLTALADSAEEVDHAIMMNREQVDASVWIKDAQRAAGDIKGRIAQIEAGRAIS